MNEQLTPRPTTAWFVAGLSALALSIAILFMSAGSAKGAYNQFCWGVNLSGPGSTCNSLTHNGLAGLITEVDGSSPDRSVCVLAWYGQGIEMCSPGPNQGVYNTTPPGLYNTVAQIRPNANGWTKVYGAMITCATPGC